MNALASPIATLASTGWVLIVATAVILFRRRIVTVLVRFAAPKDDTVAQRRDLSIGVVLLAVFGYVLAGTVGAMTLLPAWARALPLAVGLPACALLAILYWVRFSNAGLSVLGWLRR
ncbi:hypothetical protein A0130_02645 [Leifsonia xyli]|uniref:hypothetical protein n=1 Tax=Leifsonia xyli TaxID=1575 RepID=UPI0007CDFA5D|nr:hypothetical protein A0130_02645 [Leifsonia xyli]